MRRSRPRTRPPLAVVLVPGMAFVAVLPLIVRGCSCGHDFDFHILSWFEAAVQFRAGNLHPEWAFSPAFNAGEPRFVFYPPLSWALGALLGMVLSWSVVPIVFSWLTLVAGGATMYRLARQLSGANAALIAAALYIGNPYMLFTAYERTAYAELLAAAWIPLLLSAALRDRITIVRIGIPVALLWLTNAPAAVMGCYALALIAIVRLIQTGMASRKDAPSTASKACAGLALRFAAGAALGIGLAAFYIVPATYERRWVQIAMATISGMRIADNYLFHHTTDPLHDQILHTVSVIAVILLAAAGIAFATALVRARESYLRSSLFTMGTLTAAIAFMLTPLSAFVWAVLPEMPFLQFPWRLLAVLAPAVCATVAIAIKRPVSGRLGVNEDLGPSNLHGVITNWWVLAPTLLCLVAAVTFSAVSVFRQPCDDEDTVAARLTRFDAKTGTDPTDEYTPVGSDNDSLSHADPAFWLTADADGKPPASATTGLVPMHFATTAARDENLVLNLRDYPAWQVKINGSIAASAEAREDGLIAVPVHRGPVQVDITYVSGRDHTFGDGISFAALAACVAIGIGRRRDRAGRRVSSYFDGNDCKNHAPRGRGTHRFRP